MRSLGIFLFLFLAFFVGAMVLRQDLYVALAVLNSLCRPGWDQTPNLTASASQVLGVVYVTMPDYFS